MFRTTLVSILLATLCTTGTPLRSSAQKITPRGLSNCTGVALIMKEEGTSQRSKTAWTKIYNTAKAYHLLYYMSDPDYTKAQASTNSEMMIRNSTRMWSIFYEDEGNVGVFGLDEMAYECVAWFAQTPQEQHEAFLSEANSLELNNSTDKTRLRERLEQAYTTPSQAVIEQVKKDVPSLPEQLEAAYSKWFQKQQ